GQLSGRCPRAFAVGDPSPLEVPQQPGRELPSADQNPETGDETLRLAAAGPNGSCLRPAASDSTSAPSSSDQRARMANRDDQPLRGLEPDHYRRSGLKDTVSHYLSPPNPLTSTAPQPFPNNLTMPESRITSREAVGSGAPDSERRSEFSDWSTGGRKSAELRSAFGSESSRFGFGRPSAPTPLRQLLETLLLV